MSNRYIRNCITKIEQSQIITIFWRWNVRYVTSFTKKKIKSFPYHYPLNESAKSRRLSITFTRIIHGNKQNPEESCNIRYRQKDRCIKTRGKKTNSIYSIGGSIGNGPINLRSEREKERERITILKHVHGKTVAVKLGNYRSHGNHKRSLFARNLSNPLPPTSLFHGNLARGRGREGGRKGISIEEPRHKERVEGKGASFAIKNNSRSFCATWTKAGSERGGGGCVDLCARDVLFRCGSKTRGCSILLLFFSFLSFDPRESFFSFELEFEIGRNICKNLIWNLILVVYRENLDLDRFFEGLFNKVSNRENGNVIVEMCVTDRMFKEGRRSL